MKKVSSLFLITILLSFSSEAVAQLKVAASGKVAIYADTSATPLSRLAIGGSGDVLTSLYVAPHNQGYVH